ncbi:MAG: DUF1049 domain-containing protein [Alphaproteobacteria bacterium]|nr:DUF1049 domain-containing protein [Alphaproteobacteria bacterium]
MRILRWLVFVVLAILAVTFAIANRQTALVSLDPLPYTLELPVYLMTYGAVVVGMVATTIAAASSVWRRRARLRRLERDNRRLQGELDRLTAAAARAAAPHPAPTRTTSFVPLED